MFLDLEFLRQETQCYYGFCGPKSIDPVFFKLCIVGYLENIISDRKLITHCSMRLDILYFLGYDIDETLPWHSTISSTRQLYPESIFEGLFTHVFDMCVSQGMVSGHTQVIDSTPVKANASMDSLELKDPEEDLTSHLLELRHISNRDNPEVIRRAKTNKASVSQQVLFIKKKLIVTSAHRAKRFLLPRCSMKRKTTPKKRNIELQKRYV